MQKLDPSHPCGVLELSLPRSLVRSREITLIESYLSSAENFTEMNFYRKPRSSNSSLRAAAGNLTEIKSTGSEKPKLQLAGRGKKKKTNPMLRKIASFRTAERKERSPFKQGSKRHGGDALSSRARRVSLSLPLRHSGSGVCPRYPNSRGRGGGGFPSAAFICLWRAPESNNLTPSPPQRLSPRRLSGPLGGRVLGAAGARRCRRDVRREEEEEAGAEEVGVSGRGRGKKGAGRAPGRAFAPGRAGGGRSAAAGKVEEAGAGVWERAGWRRNRSARARLVVGSCVKLLRCEP